MTAHDDGLQREVLRLDELPTACGRRFGVVTLHAPETLNALSLTMVQTMLPAFRRWQTDDAIVGVFLHSAGDRAFCAGADLHELYHSLRSGEPVPSAYARGFFAEEYELDYLIHTYAKPIVCWGHGIVMGGGIGLMSGASHRVVTPASRLAMPEINIGLYPDVGGSTLLARMPGRVGLFLALTAATLDAAGALFCGAADLALPADDRAPVLAVIQATRWTGAPGDDRAAVSQLLAGRALRELPASSVREHFELINELMAGDDLLAIAARLRALRHDDPWLAKAARAFTGGSPTSAALAFELQRRARDLSLADVFRLEYDVSLGCCAHPDFVEGIRALLVDKDRKPRWTPASLEDVTPALVEDHFRPRYAGAHPLAALETR
jgi:enoyl-CoA hydratase/carnithine racemase